LLVAAEVVVAEAEVVGEEAVEPVTVVEDSAEAAAECIWAAEAVVEWVGCVSAERVVAWEACTLAAEEWAACTSTAAAEAGCMSVAEG